MHGATRQQRKAENVMENPIEVELKFPVESLEAIQGQLISLGATIEETCEQEDEYINDPLRDFAKQDKALRIRRVDDQYCLTFKGPNLDPSAKVRQEIEMSLGDALAAKQIRNTFLGIGFQSVAKVSKKRTYLTLVWQHQHVEVALDDVQEVGCFVELELVVSHANEIDTATSCLHTLADEMGLKNATQTSYIAMLLENRGEL